MKKLLLTACIATMSVLSLNAQVVFSEDFDGVGGPTAGGAGTYSFPAGWTKFNVDNRTPATAVSYVNEAWERREDFANNVADSCAFSTSWYTPAGAADDWMWTPPIFIPVNAVLKWNAVTYDPSYPDGYQVRIKTGAAPTLANQSTSTVLFSVAAENTTWTARTASLSAYSGQTIYIGFRNNSNDQFLLLIDDVVVEVPLNNDMQLLSSNPVNSQYTIMPMAQAIPFTFSGDVRNNGLSSQNNVTVTVNVLNSSMSSVYSAASTPIASLASGATAPFTVAGFTPTVADNYTIRYLVSASAVDQVPSNDTSYEYIVIDDSTYARDNGNVTGTLGIGGGGGYLGQVFDLVNPDILTSVSFYIANSGHVMDNQAVSVKVFNYNNGVPGTILDSTITHFCDTSIGQYITLPLFNGPLSLPADSFFLAVHELDSNVTLGTTNAIFNINVTNVDFPVGTGTWNNNEFYGYNVVYVLRANLGDVCLDNTSTITSSQASCISCADGSATVTPSGTNGSVSYSWAPSGGSAAAATGLLTGNYTVTITDGFGCVTMDTVSVGYDVCGLFTSSVIPTSSSCMTCADGSAQVIISGNNGPLTYQWSNGGTSDTIQNLLTGTYTVVVVDSLGCSDSVTVFVGYGICGSFTSTTSSVNASCGSCADGSAWVVPVGNNGPMTYLWSNGGTSDSIQNVLPGTYYVTITDSAGCTTTDSVVVQFGTAIASIDNNAIASVYPNPCNGVFQIDLSFAKATDATITVVNVLGDVIATQKVSGATKTRVDMKINTAPGIYSVRVTTKDDEIVLPLNVVK